MDTELDDLFQKALGIIEREKNLDALEKIRVEWLGKKGHFALKMQGLSKLPTEEKPVFGQKINELKSKIQKELETKKIDLEQKQLEYQIRKENLDITMPGRKGALGSRHPISIVRKKIEYFFNGCGFVTESGPEIDDDFHNFEALNIGKDHPARTMQDTFYINPEVVLRTHTSNVQIRTMEKTTPPLRIIAPGRVYRSDSDITHTPMFHQVEGMVLDDKTSFSDLKGILVSFLKYFFEDEELQIRFRPSYFPFTEPSAEVDIACSCKAKDNGCRICGQTGWLEVLGCGMVHPKVLENCKIDSKKYQGYAFGMGIERLAMLQYQVNDLRIFFENDIRFLNQFK